MDRSSVDPVDVTAWSTRTSLLRWEDPFDAIEVGGPIATTVSAQTLPAEAVLRGGLSVGRRGSEYIHHGTRTTRSYRRARPR
jgi:hypothetical protein